MLRHAKEPNTDIPIKPNSKRNLEDYEPGASRSDVFNALKKTAKPVKSEKRVEPLAPAS